MKIVTQISDNNSQVIQSFPAVSILKGVLPTAIVDNMYKYLENVNNNGADRQLVATISGDQSHLDVKHPLMIDFFNILLKGCFTYQNFMGREIHDVDSRHRTVILDSCWSVKMNQNDYNPLHVHGTDSRSGLATICYIKVPEHIRHNALKPLDSVTTGKSIRDGLLQFNWQSQNTSAEDDYYPEDQELIIPVVGEYYIFPKWLSHTVYPYRGAEQRWSVQTNFNVYTDEELALQNGSKNGHKY